MQRGTASRPLSNWDMVTATEGSLYASVPDVAWPVPSEQARRDVLPGEPEQDEIRDAPVVL